MASSPITSWQTEGEKVEVVTDFLFLGSKFTTDGDCGHNIRRPLPLGRKTVTNLCAEKQRHYSADKGSYSQGYRLPSSHVRLWELDHKEGRMPKDWCLRTVVLEKTFWKSLGQQEDQTSQPQGKSDPNTHWKDWCWGASILVFSCKQPTHWKSPWCWERLRAEEEEGVRRWDG